MEDNPVTEDKTRCIIVGMGGISKAMAPYLIEKSWFSLRRRNAVSGKFISEATACIQLASVSSLNRQTPAGFP